jgi:hypothetical protein
MRHRHRDVLPRTGRILHAKEKRNLTWRLALLDGWVAAASSPLRGQRIVETCRTTTTTWRVELVVVRTGWRMERVGMGGIGGGGAAGGGLPERALCDVKGMEKETNGDGHRRQVD